MQLPTHLIVGIIIQYAIMKYFPIPEWFSVVLIVVISFFSHFILDTMSKMTYHPPERVNDNFWLTWHIFVYFFGILIILIFIWKYALGMLFANIVDLWDWYTLRNIAKRKNQPDWGKEYYIHPIIDKIRSSYYFWLPNMNYKQIGIIPEILIYICWILLILINPQVF